MTDDRTTIDDLVSDLKPVTRLASLRIRLGVWLAVAGAVLAVAVYAPRPDLAERITRIDFLIELIGLALVAVLLGGLALRNAEPDRTPDRGMQMLGWTLAVLVVVGSTLQPLAAHVSMGEFLAVGIRCAWATLKFAAIPALVLLIAIKRGAPVQPSTAAAFATGAGLVLAYLAMRLHCPMDEGSHLLVWHAFPVVVGTAAGAGLGKWWLAGWHR